MPTSQYIPRTGSTPRGAQLRSIELFTGAGGLALGTHAAGFRHELLVEWDAKACETIRANASARLVPGIETWNVRVGDVRDVDFSQFIDLDLVAGGAPCQPFSIGGKHRGMEDVRDMIPEFVRAVRDSRPRAFLLENVRGLLRRSFADYFAYILLQLEHPSVERETGETWQGHRRRLDRAAANERPEYNVRRKLVNAADYGVPQVRWRVFVTGLRADEAGIECKLPAETHSRDALLATQWITGDYWRRHEIAAPPTPDRVAPRVRQLERQLPLTTSLPWRTVRDAIGHLPPPSPNAASESSDNSYQPGARSYYGHSGSEWDLPSKTLKSGVHGVPGGENMLREMDGTVRYFTVQETALLQTFPPGWTFRGPWGETMRQLGNAVPVELAQVVAEEIARRLLVESPTA